MQEQPSIPIHAGRRGGRWRPLAGCLAACAALVCATAAQANSWCDDIDTGGVGIASLPASTAALKQIALDLGQEVVLRQQATVGLCRFAEKGDREVLDTLVTLTSDGKAAIRAAGVHTLGLLGGEEEREVVQRSLYDEDPAVRRSAAFALAQLGCERCLDDLAETLADRSQATEVRELAAIALGKSRHEAAIPVLRAQLDDGTGAKEVGNLPILSALALAALADESGLSLLASAALSPETREGLRVKAILAVESLTGEKFGYSNPYFVPSTREQRELALERLSGWWQAYGEGVSK